MQFGLEPAFGCCFDMGQSLIKSLQRFTHSAGRCKSLGIKRQEKWPKHSSAGLAKSHQTRAQSIDCLRRFSTSPIQPSIDYLGPDGPKPQTMLSRDFSHLSSILSYDRSVSL